MKKQKRITQHQTMNSGFTLIELLIVIAIIGILAALLLTNLVGIRQRARDAQRKSDMRQIQASLELYRSDNGSYPVTASFPACGSQLQGTGVTPPTYMQKIPCDPLTNASYAYASDGTTYTIIGCLENSNDNQADKNSGGTNNTSVCPSTTNTYSITLTNP
ncbi:MAG TPA: prepilin-type N-terminal cleavage/methylation domain-containing protein [Patescibacteria group bacterium]|nr:prepilin-type N-terminal cleavage/methylation domain-containing protein [Patescibacteria group bacterium]